eukprot:gene8880-8969_t
MAMAGSQHPDERCTPGEPCLCPETTMSDTAPARRPSNSFAATGFLVMCFAIVGLVGIFATFAAPLPLYRAMLRDTALDDALVAMQGPQPEAALAALKPRLDDSAAAFSPMPADPAAAVAGERQAMHRRFREEADATGHRMKLMIGIVTVMAAIFGAAITGLGRR